MHFSHSKFASPIAARFPAHAGPIARRGAGRWLAVPLVLAMLAALCVMGLPAGAQRNLGAQRPRIGQPGSFVPGQIIVGLKPGVTEDQMKKALADANAVLLRPLLLKPYYLISISGANGQPAADQVTMDAAKALSGTGLFKWSQPNYYLYKTDTTPNDPQYPQQWHYPLINLPKAWDIAKGNSNTIFVSCDTGVDIAHDDLKNSIVPNAARNFTVDPPDSDVHDAVGHGTHTSGTMNATTNNALGVAGVSFGGCGLVPVKVLGDTGSGAFDWVTNGIMYAAQTIKTPTNFVIINLSLGASIDSDTPDLTDPVEQACVTAAQQYNCLLSISAGNAYQAGNPASIPARVAQLDARIFCVASCGALKEHADYSTARPYTTITAPGGNGTASVLSTLPNNSYGGDGWQGTSMAAPHISGVLALLLAAGATPDQCKDIITSTADTVGQPVPNAFYGYGVVDAFAAVERAASGISLASPANGAFVYGNVNVQLVVPPSAGFTGAQLSIDSDPTVVASTTGSPYTLVWNSLATDPKTGAPLYTNGTHTLKVTVTANVGTLTFTRSVRLDNPFAQITSPGNNAFVAKSVTVVGTVDGFRTPSYSLDYGAGASPTTFTPIVTDQPGKVQAGALGTFDTTKSADGVVTLRLRAKNPDGFVVTSTSAVTVDNTPPSVPANVVAVSGNRQATLNWNTSTDNFVVAGYNLYRSDQAITGYAKVNTALLNPGGGATTVQYIDTGLLNGKTYYYQVTAVDAAGNESPPTQFVDVTPNKNGTTNGQVQAIGGAFIPGASITVLDATTDQPVPGIPVTTTDSAGQYTFVSPPGLPAGTYDLKASAPGYVPSLIRGVTVSLGHDAPNENFVLAPQPTFPSGWSLFTLPYDYLGQPLTSVLTDSGGNAFQLSYYDPVSGRYVAPGDPAFPAPKPGIAYWINAGSAAPQVTGAGVPNVPSTTTPTPIHKGWNALGNPYQYPIRWVLNDFIITRGDNGQQATLTAATGLGWTLDFGWGGPTGHTLLYDQSVIPGISDTIPAYGGFWFFSNVDGTLSIAPPAVVGRAARAAGGANQWTALIQATSGGQTASAYFGLAATARVFPLAPQVSQGPTLSFASARSASDNSGGLGVDLRTASNTQTWDLIVDGSASPSQPVTLTWPGIATLPHGWTLTLIDKDSGQRTSLRTASGLTLAASRSAHHLQLMLTRSAGHQMAISSLAVIPGRGATPTIVFTLANAGQATVSVLNQSGQTIRTVASRAVTAGSNSLVWDGRDSAGRSVPPGVYLIQVRASAETGESARAVVPYLLTR